MVFLLNQLIMSKILTANQLDALALNAFKFQGNSNSTKIKASVVTTKANIKLQIRKQLFR